MKNYLKLIFVLLVLFAAPFLAHADVFGTCNSSNPSADLCNPIKSGTLPELLSYTMIYVGSVIGLIAIATLVYAGVRMILANGNDKIIDESKQTIYYTIMGFVISVFAYAGIIAIENFIGVQKLEGDRNAPFNPLASTSLEKFVGTMLQNVIVISGLIAMFMIILNGSRYMRARGDEKAVHAAKIGLTWSLVGLAVILFAYVIISAVGRLIS
jgi:hypothetical protein